MSFQVPKNPITEAGLQQMKDQIKRLMTRINRFNRVRMISTAASIFLGLCTFAGSISAFTDVRLLFYGIKVYIALALLSFIISCLIEITKTRLKKITICHAIKTLHYLPLYVAMRTRFFEDNGLDVSLIDGVGDGPTWENVATQKADFGISDPLGMLKANATSGVIVATIASRAAIWGVSKKTIGRIQKMEEFKRLKTSVYKYPSTQFKILEMAIKSSGGEIEKCMVQHDWGSELIPLSDNKVDIVFLSEPFATMAERSGANYNFSGPRILGEYLHSGCYCSKEYLKKNPEIVQAVVNSFDSAVNLIHKNHLIALEVVQKEFSHLPKTKVELATIRLIDEKIIPHNVSVDQHAWINALKVWFPETWQNYKFIDSVENKFAQNASNRNKR
jgi:NitT/TauT family transport system substrate-binding protein